jgi:co-chaperonin GroES (HSP10)
MIQPAGHKCLVVPEEVEEKTQGGLYVPIATKERRQNEQVIGTLVEIGINCWKAFDDGVPWASVGDRVFYARNGGWKIKDPDTGKEYCLLNDEDICAVIVK